MRFLALLFFAFTGLLSACDNIDKPDTATENTSPQLASNDAPVTASPAADTKLPLDKIKLPEGFRIGIYAADVPNARSMVRSPNGTIFIGTRNEGKVYAVRDTDNDYYADKVYTLAEDMNMPNGVAFKDGDLYVAEVSKVWRFDDIEDHLEDGVKPVLVSDKFPSETHHGWKYIAFGPDGKLYVPVGAPCNICDKDKEGYSNIMRMNADGSGLEVFARGIRNTVGFAWHPQTNELWFTDNGRDMMGDNIPPDELNHAPRAGMHFGYPFCHGGDIPDPKFGKEGDCEKHTPPIQKLAPHTAALGMLFYGGSQFPRQYQGDIFIAEHGSWNRSSPIGYRVMRVKLNGNKATSYEPFATGWLEGGDAWGRPVALLTLPDGSMLVSDDNAGVVYRIWYDGK